MVENTNEILNRRERKEPKVITMPGDLIELKKLSEHELQILRFKIIYPEMQNAEKMSTFDREQYLLLHPRTDQDLNLEQKRKLLYIDTQLAVIDRDRRLIDVKNQRKELEKKKKERKEWVSTGDDIERFCKMYAEFSTWGWSTTSHEMITNIAAPKFKELLKEYKLEHIFIK